MKKNRIIAILLSLLLLVAAVPTTLFASVIAREGSANPLATGNLFNSRKLDEYQTEKDPVKGWVSEPRAYEFTNVKTDLTEDELGYNKENKQAYCINYGGKFRGEDLTKYLAYRPENSGYWKSLNDTQKMGFTLVAEFGYTSKDWKLLTEEKISERDAIAATQALLWEFNLGTRTDFTSGANNKASYHTWAYAMLENHTGAVKI